MTAVEVYLAQVDGDRLVGRAHFTRQRRVISTTFLYDPTYLAVGGPNIDPAFMLVTGSQHQQGLPGSFADTAPDRWGRNLIEKAERVVAREEGRVPRSLDDLDFLLGVSDDTRQGALRFRYVDATEFLGKPSTVPKLIALPTLLRASDELVSTDDSAPAVKQLLDTGTTGLGGARPKASVRLDDGGLAIAKFPHSSDGWDVMAWEATALDLLEVAGVRTPERTLARIGDRSVLVLRRFDRTRTGERIGYISAMTATQSRDGEQRDYVDIAQAVRDISSNPKQDLRELFHRVAVSVAIGNTDDHLRNHGLLNDGDLWRLSPVFDVNPNPDLARSRSTTICGADILNDEPDGLLAFAQDCDLTQPQAVGIIADVCQRLAGWRDYARNNAVPARELSMMAYAIDSRLKALQAITQK